MNADPYEADPSDPAIEFRISNAHTNPFVTNYHYWRMHKHVDGEWWYLGVFEPHQTLDTLGPSESHTWEMTIDNDSLGTPDEQLAPSASSSFAVAGLGAGIYTFSVVGKFRRDDTTLAVVAPFELTGQDVDLVPASNVETTREGATIRVQETYTSRGREHRIKATRRAATENVPRLVPEWGLRQRGIRNTVPFLGDEIEKAVFSTTGPTVYARDRIDGATFAYGDFAVEFDLIEV